jgi:hypothetical protein
MGKRKTFKLQQFHTSATSARKEVSTRMRSQHGGMGDLTSLDWKIKSVKLCKTGPSGEINKRINGRKLYDVTLETKVRKERKGHPFRGK